MGMIGYLPYLIPLAALALSARFGYIYFTSVDYADHQERPLQQLLPLAATALVLAAYLGVTEILARARAFPMTIFPIEHMASLQRVSLNLALAFAGFSLAWLASHSRRVAAALPGLRLVLPLAALAVLLSASAHYVSWIGFCCETPLGIFFGFPFSYVYGIAGSDPAALTVAQSGLARLLPALPAIVYGWNIRLYPLLLDGLFWINGLVCLLTAKNLAGNRAHR